MVRAEPQREPPTAPRPGTVIGGKYEVETLVGAGAMGFVSVARHRDLGHKVAIKSLKVDATSEPNAAARLVREARACVELKSEHVARVLDVGGLDDGQPYIVMEYLEGEDLATHLKRATETDDGLSIEDAVDYVLQAAEAVAEAHMNGIVHRDLKPANLFLTKRADGSALIKVLDFGIAKIDSGEDAHALTASSTSLGTPSYMSPEQVRDSKTVDPRSDVWALGAVLFELLAGEPPFRAENLPSLTAKIIADPPAPLRSSCPQVAPGLEAVIERCLAKDATDRYQSMHELALALSPFSPERSSVYVERIAGMAPDPTSSGTTTERRSEPAKARRGMRDALMVGMLGAAVVAVAVAGWPSSAARRHTTTRAESAMTASVAPERPSGPGAGSILSAEALAELPAPPTPSVSPDGSPEGVTKPRPTGEQRPAPEAPGAIEPERPTAPTASASPVDEDVTDDALGDRK